MFDAIKKFFFSPPNNGSHYPNRHYCASQGCWECAATNRRINSERAAQEKENHRNRVDYLRGKSREWRDGEN